MKKEMPMWKKIVIVVAKNGSIVPAIHSNTFRFGVWINHSIERVCRQLSCSGYLIGKETERGYRMWVKGKKFNQLVKKMK